jgi:hypothetical protein
VVHIVVVIMSTINVKVWQRSGSGCCCYIVYHYCLMFDRGEVHVVVTLSTVTNYGLTEEWVMLFLLCLPLLFKFWQRSGSCCCCYVFYHYCLMFDRGVVHAVVVILSTITVLGKTEKWFILLLLYCLQLLFKVWERSGSYCCCYNVYHYCFRFDRGVVHFVLVILSTITAQGLTEEWFMLLLLYCLPLLF